MSTGLNQQDNGISLSDAVGSFKSRKRKSIVVTVSLLIVSLLVLTIGVAATTRTHNVTVGGYYPGAILGFGSFLGIIGAHLIENKRQMDLRPLYAGRCKYHSSVMSNDLEVHCHASSQHSCNLRVKSNTCYCCELYTCGSRVELTGGYHEYTEVRSCQDVVQLYHLLWFATILNVVALLLGIVTAAVLGGFKDMTPTGTTDICERGPPPALAPAPPLPEVPGPSHTPGSCYNSAPCLPPYTAYDLQGSSMFPDSSGLSDDSQSGASYLWPSQIPPRYSPPYYPPDEKPPPYSP
ncbi:transmembrane protein 255A-like isoform X2 [Brienomyrus brachyistius]|uniref:transmembrane protein 255A-like isoform X2 n=1 Tax=Brienomyrus brachyistius TaxID=42636 RepID=UPI0020B315B7|nr:transmembrane protein 255A-like isoform X2 [Brienomyrus brachyistius]